MILFFFLKENIKKMEQWVTVFIRKEWRMENGEWKEYDILTQNQDSGARLRPIPRQKSSTELVARFCTRSRLWSDLTPPSPSSPGTATWKPSLPPSSDPSPTSGSAASASALRTTVLLPSIGSLAMIADWRPILRFLFFRFGYFVIKENHKIRHFSVSSKSSIGSIPF